MDAAKIFKDKAILKSADGSEMSIEQIQEWLNRQHKCSLRRGKYDRLCDPAWAQNCERIEFIPLMPNGYPMGLKSFLVYVDANAARWERPA